MSESSICPYCGDTMANPRRVQCGKPECIRQWNNERQKAHGKAWRDKLKAEGRKRNPNGYRKVCGQCGKEFFSHYDRPGTCCSVECWQSECAEGRRQKLLPILHPNPAPYTWLPANHPVVLMQQPQYQRLFIGGTCARCGRSFIVWAPGGEARYCSDACQRLVAKGKRRAKKRTVRMEPYDRIKIFERDGWRCHICGRKVNRSVHWNHSSAPSIDHLVPLSAGGADAPDNVACAHRLCNSVKSHTGGAQLRLCG